ncbi:ribonuclease Z, partial [Halolamina salina]
NEAVDQRTISESDFRRAREAIREAGEIAQRAGAKRLALTHISSRYPGDASGHEREAGASFDGDCFVAEDGRTIEIPFPDGE